jgi:hypothetical protein
MLDDNYKSTLLPNLHTFNCLDLDLDLGIVVDMLSSRWKPAAMSNGNMHQSAAIDIGRGSLKRWRNMARIQF